MSTERESNAALEPREKSQLLRWSRSEGKMDAEVLSSQKKGSGACGAGDRAGTLRGRKRIGRRIGRKKKANKHTHSRWDRHKPHTHACAHARFTRTRNTRGDQPV